MVKHLWLSRKNTQLQLSIQYYIKKKGLGYLHMHRCMHAHSQGMYSKHDSKDSLFTEFNPLALKHLVI